MNPFATHRPSSRRIMPCLGWALLAALACRCAPASAAVQSPAPAGHLVVLSITDLKGKTSPCYCHPPKGGLARMATFSDSVRAVSPSTVFAVAGGTLPELEGYEDDARFVLEMLVRLHADAIGLSEKDLHFGRSLLLEFARQTHAPFVCANLLERDTRQPLVAPWRIKRAGAVTVGFFGLTSDKVDPGPTRDSLLIDDPLPAAKRAVDALHAQGATVIVLLSELGRAGSEELAAAVPGIDVVICGRDVPAYQKGRTVGHTTFCYGGEQGQFMGSTDVRLDGSGQAVSADCTTWMLSPGVHDQPDIAALVKLFEGHFQAHVEQLDRERNARDELSRITGGATSDAARDHFLGATVCARCHATEFAQWQATRHARAWQSLVDAKAGERPECLSCHVTGARAPGGFRAAEDSTKTGGVQCEMCHGMGSQHDAYPVRARRITAATCGRCHDDANDAGFDYAHDRPYVDHTHAVQDLPARAVHAPAKR